MSAKANLIIKKAVKAAASLKPGTVKFVNKVRDVIKKEVGNKRFVGRGFFFTIPALIAGATALAKAGAVGGASAVGGHLANKALKGRGLYTGRGGGVYRGRGLYTREIRRKAYKSVKAAGGAAGRFLVRGARRVGQITKAAAIIAAKDYIQREGPAALMDTLGRAYEAYN